MKRKSIIVSIIILLGVLGGVFLLLQSSDSPATTSSTQQNTMSATDDTLQTEPTDNEVETESNEVPRLIIGDESAPVTITEYSDFQCPFCERFFRETEPQIREAYIDKGLVKIDYRPEVHIGEGSIIAAQGAYCAAEQDQFEQYHKAVFTQRGSGELGVITKPAIARTASALELNQTAFNECLNNDTYREAVLTSHNEANQEVGISGTPTFLIGERQITGAQPFSIFKPIIDAELARTN